MSATENEVKSSTAEEKETKVEIKKSSEPPISDEKTAPEPETKSTPTPTPKQSTTKKGVLLGHRILRDFSQDYNKKTPIYFIGIITEYQPTPKPSDLQTIFPSKQNKKSKQQSSLDNGLYRIRYLDKDKDEISPAEAYAGVNLYNTFFETNQKAKVHTKDLDSFFEYKKYPNPNHFLMNDLVNEEKYYYECYKDYLEENKIKPSKTLVVPLNETVAHMELMLTEFGYVAASAFDESMKRVDQVSTPKKRGRKSVKTPESKRAVKYTPVSKRKQGSPAKEAIPPVKRQKAEKSPKTAKPESTPPVKRQKAEKSPKTAKPESMEIEKSTDDNNLSKNDTTATSEAMDVETSNENDSKPPQDKESVKDDLTKVNEENKDTDEQLNKEKTSPTTNIDSTTKKQDEKETKVETKEDEKAKEELNKVNKELKDVNEQLEKEKAASSPKTSQHIDEVTKSQDETYKNTEKATEAHLTNDKVTNDVKKNDDTATDVQSTGVDVKDKLEASGDGKNDAVENGDKTGDVKHDNKAGDVNNDNKTDVKNDAE